MILEEKNLKVLIVEDNILVVEFIKKLVVKFGHSIAGIASDGKTAVDMASNIRPDLVLMDIGLPVIDGIEAARMITESNPTPIIMLTSYDDLELVEKASTVGAGAYLTKPINPDSLERAIIVSRARFKDMLALRMLNLNLVMEIETRKKTEEALIKSEEELKRANSSKDKIFSIVSHDLRSPLATLLSLLDIASDSQMDMDFRNSLLVELKQQTKNTLDMVENLLQWSRNQQRRIEPKFSIVALNPIISDILELYDPNIRKKSIRVNNECDNSVKAYADKDMVNTVIRNLISNAIKFTPENGEIRVKVKATDQSVEVSVGDSGVGISPEDQGRLFNVTTHFTTYGTAKEKGTGLGLILCRELVGLQKGTFYLDSEKGKGSTFTFSLQREDAASTAS
ncbi:MAG: hybrid sensor histidine kinase/response regulator [Candidatus Riflebacteria bacterium]|nr:hybrid sensor histidine kinase/response regulator [Candidatus Riflebacteria bacterium]